MTNNVVIRREVMDLLVMLDKSQANGQLWTSIPGTVFEKDVRDWALQHKLIETNTVDGEATVYRITEEGQRAMIHGKAPDVSSDELASNSRKLHPQIRFLLNLLADALSSGDGWVFTKHIELGDVPYPQRKEAQQKGYVDGRGNNHNREYRITRKGLDAINRPIPLLFAAPTTRSAAEQIEASSQRVLAKKAAAAPLSVQSIESVIPKATSPTSFVAERMHVVAEDLRPSTTDELPARVAVSDHNGVVAHIQIQDDCADDCNDCVYREAVDLLKRNVPGVTELVNGLKLIKSRK